jgi:hypothetical protein
MFHAEVSIKGNKLKVVFDDGKEKEYFLTPELQWKPDGSPRTQEEIRQEILKKLGLSGTIQSPQ